MPKRKFVKIEVTEQELNTILYSLDVYGEGDTAQTELVEELKKQAGMIELKK